MEKEKQSIVDEKKVTEVRKKKVRKRMRKLDMLSERKRERERE
jgi:hypothetical protein